jgi:Insertion element 4 transposase N-terminal
LTGLVNMGVLTRWVSADLVSGAVAGRARVAGRPSPLTPEFMVYFVLGLALWSTDS